MTEVKHHLFIFITSLAILALATACSEPGPVNKLEIATSFVQAINQNNIGKTVALSAASFSIRNQKWESASDGRGFVLGNAQDSHLSGKTQLKDYFIKNIKNIGIEGTSPSRATLTLLKNELSDIEGRWQGLDMYLFLRGMGDVEHIFVLGINEKGKVSAIYFN